MLLRFVKYGVLLSYFHVSELYILHYIEMQHLPHPEHVEGGTGQTSVTRRVGVNSIVSEMC